MKFVTINILGQTRYQIVHKMSDKEFTTFSTLHVINTCGANPLTDSQKMALCRVLNDTLYLSTGRYSVTDIDPLSYDIDSVE